MEQQEVLAQLIQVLAPVAKGRAIDGRTDLVGDLALDSLQVMNLMLSVEDRFDVSIPVNLLADVKTVQDLATKIATRVNHE